MRTSRVIALVVALLCLAPPARAASQIGLSWDGRTWTTQLSGTLFNRSGSVAPWVPGDSDTEHFHVRNQGGDAARLRIEYDLPPDPLVNPDDVAVTAAVDGGAPVVIAPGVGWLPLDEGTLADGAVADVAVTATFGWTSTNQSMDEAFPIDFRVTLTEVVGASPLPDASSSPHATASPTAVAGSAPGAGQGPDGAHGAHSGGSPLGGLLPNTGAPEVGRLVGLGVLCLGGGTLIVALSRRRRKHDADPS